MSTATFGCGGCTGPLGDRGAAGTALWHLGQASYIHAKAWLAQYLIRAAWERSLATGTTVKPWSWADTWPVARLVAPRQDADLYVLAGDSGRSLAFGPGHRFGTPAPGARATQSCRRIATPISRFCATPPSAMAHGECAMAGGDAIRHRDAGRAQERAAVVRRRRARPTHIGHLLAIRRARARADRCVTSSRQSLRATAPLRANARCIGAGGWISRSPSPSRERRDADEFLRSVGIQPLAPMHRSSGPERMLHRRRPKSEHNDDRKEYGPTMVSMLRALERAKSSMAALAAAEIGCCGARACPSAHRRRSRTAARNAALHARLSRTIAVCSRSTERRCGASPSRRLQAPSRRAC